MTDKNTVMGWLEGLAQDDWRQWHSDSEVQETAKAALALLKEKEAQRDYEASIEMAEYCERYEQTYNPEDGSM